MDRAGQGAGSSGVVDALLLRIVVVHGDAADGRAGNGMVMRKVPGNGARRRTADAPLGLGRGAAGAGEQGSSGKGA